MGTVYLVVAVLASTCLWPVSRWVMAGDSKPVVYGFWSSLVATPLLLLLALGLRQRIILDEIWAVAALSAVTSTIGYWVLVMYCLGIGPVGPTVAMNNMGLVWPVVLGAVWLRPHPFNAFLAAGCVLVCLAIVSMACSRNSGKPDAAARAHRVTLRWLVLAAAAWLLAGVTMTTQVAMVVGAPDNPLGIMWTLGIMATGILLPLAGRHEDFWARKRERIGGMVSGVIMVFAGTSMFVALDHFVPAVVYPITVGGPLVLMLLLGSLVYRERLTWAGWLACVLGTVGIISLSIGRGVAQPI